MAKEENNGFGPIPRRRGTQLVKVCSLLFVALFMILALALEDVNNDVVLKELHIKQRRSINETVIDATIDEQVTSLLSLAKIMYVSSASIIILVISEVIRRFCLLTEELRHFHDRYDGKVSKILKATYRVRQYQSLSVLFILALAVLLILWWYTPAIFSGYFYRYRDLMLVNMAVACLTNVFLSLKTPSDVEISEFSEQDHLNVAHGLAWSFYFGYLNIILPELENTIAKSEWNDKMKDGDLPAKVFIVIPESCVIPSNIGEDHPNVIFQNKLPPVIKHRAGVRDRQYVNSVYQVTDVIRGYPQYCILEYATPIASLYDMSMHPESGLNAEDRHQQVQIFLRTLQKILDSSPECRKRCVLVPISGSDYGKYPLASVITKTIRQVKGETFDIDEDGIEEEGEEDDN
ncbi:stimulator of interferon genes protein 2-like [Glandiceps talaboti]